MLGPRNFLDCGSNAFGYYDSGGYLYTVNSSYETKHDLDSFCEFAQPHKFWRIAPNNLIATSGGNFYWLRPNERDICLRYGNSWPVEIFPISLDRFGIINGIRLEIYDLHTNNFETIFLPDFFSVPHDSTRPYYVALSLDPEHILAIDGYMSLTNINLATKKNIVADPLLSKYVNVKSLSRYDQDHVLCDSPGALYLIDFKAGTVQSFDAVPEHDTLYIMPYGNILLSPGGIYSIERKCLIQRIPGIALYYWKEQDVIVASGEGGLTFYSQ